jgi:hypothetical protein
MTKGVKMDNDEDIYKYIYKYFERAILLRLCFFSLTEKVIYIFLV